MKEVPNFSISNKEGSTSKILDREDNFEFGQN